MPRSEVSNNASRDKEDEEIHFPPGNKLAVWQYVGFYRKDDLTDKTCDMQEMLYTKKTQQTMTWHLGKKHGVDHHANVDMNVSVDPTA